MITSKVIIGTWILESYFVEHQDGKLEKIWPDYRGYLLYTASGDMSVNICRHPPSSDLTIKEVIAYSGTFEVLNDHIVHNIYVSSVARYVDTSEKRHASISEGKLILITKLSTSGLKHLVTWKRK